MNINSIIENRRVKKKPEFALNIGDVCKTIGISVPQELDANDKFSCVDIQAKGALAIANGEVKKSTVDKAKSYGAKALLTEKAIEGIPCLVVPNVFDAILEIAKMLYEKIDKKPVIVVAGSVGKTSTKTLLNKVMEQRYDTFCYEKNANTLRSLCFLIQRLDKKSNLMIQEVDESIENDTKYCSLVLKPEIALITNMAEAHIGSFGGHEGIIKSILAIETGITEDGIVIINADDEYSMQASFTHKVIKVGIKNKDADCIATNIKETENGISFDINYQGETIPAELFVDGRQNIYNALMVFVAGKKKNLTNEEILKGLKKFRNSGFRQNIWNEKTKLIYADCYNSSPKSVDFALKTFEKIPAKISGKKVVVLGDISAIEGFEEYIYKKVAKTVDKVKFDILITVGEYSGLINEYTTNNCEKYHVETIEELNKLLKQIDGSRGGTNYLFKASRSVGLEDSIAEVFPKIYKKNIIKDNIKQLKWKIKSRMS